MNKLSPTEENLRLEPILLTSICTIVGIIPITFTNAMWTPLGLALIFGHVLYILYAPYYSIVVLPFCTKKPKSTKTIRHIKKFTLFFSLFLMKNQQVILVASSVLLSGLLVSCGSSTTDTATQTGSVSVATKYVKTAANPKTTISDKTFSDRKSSP